MAFMLAISLAGVFFALAALHLMWLVRPGSLKASTAVPTRAGRPVLSPGPISTSIVALLLIAAGLTCLWRVGVLGSQYPAIPHIGMWVIAAVFLARAIGDFRYVGFFKSIRDSTFARLDSILYSPLCAAIALASFWLAMGDRAI